MHTTAPLPLWLPPGHMTAVLFVDAAVGHEYPAEQFRHADHPERLYWPALHCVCVAIGDLTPHTYPALQLLQLDDPARAY